MTYGLKEIKPTRMLIFWVAYKKEDMALPHAAKFPSCEHAAEFERDIRLLGYEIVKLNSIAEYVTAEKRV